MPSNGELLKEYRATGKASVFARLVGQYSGLIYGTALRVTGNAEDARDVTQECFLQLAHNRDCTLRCLPAWLHRMAVNRSLDLVKAEARRRRRQRIAGQARLDAEAEAVTWEQIVPHLDAALNTLPEELREPVILHFLHEQTQGDVATRLNIGQASVSRRIQRGLEQLRKHLSKAGIPLSAAALAIFIQENVSLAAPAGLVAALGTSASTAGTSAETVTAAAAGGTATTGGVSAMKLIVIGLATAAAITIGIVVTQVAGQEEVAPQSAPPTVAKEEPVTKPAPPAKQSEMVTYKGVVVDKEGIPIEGVRVRSDVPNDRPDAWVVYRQPK